jgi:uncharacterized protein (TIGR03437 family)
MRLADTSPGIFSVTGDGKGQGAILNANGLNSGGNPAAKGSIIQIFATGAGMWDNKLGGDGWIVSTLLPYPVPLAPVSVTIGGQAAQIMYAGAAPNLVSGALQVNAVVPDGVASGPQPVVLMVGANSNSSQQITVAVQ